MYSQVTVKPYRLGASLGYSFTGYREETYSPLNMFLNTLTFIIDGNIEKGRFFHSLNMGFYMGNADTANPATAAISQLYDHSAGEAYDFVYYPQYLAIRGNLEYALDYRLWGNDVFPGYLGGAFRTDVYMQFAHYPSITGIVSLGVHATQKWIVNPQSSFVLSMGIPIFGYAIRPPFAGSDAALMKYAEEDPIRIITLGQVVSLHNYWAILGDLKYHHTVNTLLSLYYGLGFEFSHINIPRPRRDAIFRMSAGLSFTFGSN
jgi:hypothetical protein